MLTIQWRNIANTGAVLFKYKHPITRAKILFEYYQLLTKTELLQTMLAQYCFATRGIYANVYIRLAEYKNINSAVVQSL